MFADQLPPWVNTTSARVGAGLGTIARVVASGETIYRGKLSFAEAERRVRQFWQPFHETLAAMNKGGRASTGLTMELAARAKRHGIIPELSFVLGSPPDPMADVAIALRPQINAFLRQRVDDQSTTEDADAQLLAIAAEIGGMGPQGGQAPAAA